MTPTSAYCASGPGLGDPAQLEARRVRGAIRQRLFGIKAEALIIGRYELSSPLGAGAMGTVFLARDAELKRDVALKVIRPRSAEEHAEAARRRLLREARAMARLRHPNVVTVYEAGLADDCAFIAMEYVAGSTLRAWLKAAPRSAQQVVAVFVQAGQGLAAAHQKALVHRDFKPENVLIGDDGRVQVTDFGVARALQPSSIAFTPEPHDRAPEQPNASIHGWPSPATEGARAGTPRYMAPEQHWGQPVDARTDQFAFCVALYEALYGQLPFAGTSMSELGASMIAGRVLEPRAQARVPSWLRRVVLRGLKCEPAARFASMQALLAALEPRKRPWRRGLLTTIVLGALAAGSLATATMPRLGQAGSERAATQKASAVATFGARRRAVPQPDAAIGPLVIAEGRARVGNTWLPEFTVARSASDESASLLEAYSGCRARSLSLCTEAQWLQACSAEPRLGGLQTWTLTPSAEQGFVVRGGEQGCASRSVARGGERSARRAGLCCSRAVAISSPSRSRRFLAAASTTLLKLESVLSSSNGAVLASMAEDSVQYFHRPTTRAALPALLQQDAREHPDRWVLLDVCEATASEGQGNRAWAAECRVLSQQGAELSYVLNRYDFGGQGGKLTALAEALVFRPLSPLDP